MAVALIFAMIGRVLCEQLLIFCSKSFILAT